MSEGNNHPRQSAWSRALALLARFFVLALLGFTITVSISPPSNLGDGMVLLAE